jgi:hypothetical protein
MIKKTKIYFWLTFGLSNAINTYLRLKMRVVCEGRVSEPEPGGSKTLRHPVDILLLELMKAYIF